MIIGKKFFITEMPKTGTTFLRNYFAQYQDIGNGWVIPDEGDQCWINLKCTMEKQPAVIIQGSFFKTAYKK